jgi:hypothetical protein
MSFLAAESFDFTDGHTLDANVSKGILDLFQLERLDDGFDFFHGL